ncbi:MAG: PAS domain S-box protein [Phenylobacterium sp.]|uniref:PAS domain-containing protein n=1 Tax=Phenylobacterium sp. TaxID=1871053 RepID=UPI001227187C|nr:PAS domain-containing protein [Phenylobacterium sp.]TAJ72790.1 MAG: PAS domain S-box protein [Phenylobacterium sp.]
METDQTRLLDALPGMVWTARPDGTCDFVNRHWRAYTGLTLEQATSAGWTSLFHPDDVATAMAAWERTLGEILPEEINVVARMRRFDGVYRRFNLQTRPLRDAAGKLVGWCGANTDIEDRTRAEAQLAAEKQLLELVARGLPQSRVLNELCLLVEALSPGSVCSILYVDEDGQRFRVGAGPNLPAEYNAALDGLKIDPGYGPCSLAVVSRSTIIAADPPRDPRWASSSWPQLLTGFGLASCWSAPIFDSQNAVLGIFAIYKHLPQGPTDQDEELVDRFARIAGIAIERARSDIALKAGEAKLRQANHFLTGGQRLSKTGSFSLDTATDEQVWSDENFRIWEFDPGVPPTMEMVAAAIHPEDRAEMLETFASATRAREGFEVFYRIVTPIGGVKHLHTRMEIIPDASGRVMYLGSSQDVTEGKLAEAALMASEAGLRRANRYLAGAQRLSKTGSFTWDVATDDQDWSEELHRIWEMGPEDDRAVPTLHASVVHPEDVESVEAIMAPALEAGADYEVSYRIITPSGATKHLHTVNERLSEITDRLVYVGATQDLTASRRAEEALRTSEAQLRRANRYLKAAQTLSRIGSFTWDVETDELDWSDENYRIWEVDPAVTPTVAMVIGAIHPDDLDRVNAVLEEGRRSGRDFDVVYRIVTSSGVVKHLYSIGARIPEITDHIVYIGSHQDVTQSKLAEAALRASEADAMRANRYLKGAQALSRIGSFTWDVEADAQDWSDENFRIWEFDPSSAPTMPKVLDVIHPEDVSAAGQAIAEGRRSGQDFEISYRIVTKSGAVKHLHTIASRVPEISERLVYIGSTQDVTATKLAEAELARANTYLLAAQRLSQTGSFTWDVHADEHNWSEVNYRVFGFEPGTKVTMDMMMKGIHPDDLAGVEALIGGAQIGENFELVFRVINTDGGIRYAHVVGHRIDQIPDRPVFMGALQDITARKLAEDDLNRAREDLAHVARITALSTLTASIAHEVSQPLAGIITNSSTCLRMLAADPPDVAGALATAQRNLRDGNRASEVIKRLRSLYGRRPPTFETVDLQEIATEVLALLASELQRRRVIVRTEFRAGAPTVSADRVQLQQVILNLALNAADAMSEVTDRVRELSVGTEHGPEGEVSLVVRDSGHGFDPEGADKLFQAFHTTKPNGMGIGLSISRSIIEAHGGRLKAAPNDGGPGATFTFSIPCDPPSVASATSRSA